MKNGVKPIPEGMHTLTPHLVVRNAAQAIEFYKKAFGAVELHRMPMPDGRLMHAALKFGNSTLFMADEFPEHGGCKGPSPGASSPVTLHVCVENIDAVFNQAVAAGAAVKMPPADMFWGDRYAKLTDPFGHEWSLSTRIENLTPEQMHQRGQEMMAKMGSKA
jgi:uncharacterized glyoxalase superfamily protein PhnB